MTRLLDERRPTVGGHRRGIDDHAAAARDEVRPRGARDGEDQVELVAQREPPVIPGHLREQPHSRRRGVVVEHVDPAGTRDRPADPRRSGAGIGEGPRGVPAYRPAPGPDLFGHRLRPRRVEIAPDHGGALGGENASGRGALPAGRPGDQRDLAVEPPHQPFSTSSTRLPSGSATNANRTPGSGDGRGSITAVAPAASALANTSSMSGAASAKWL